MLASPGTPRAADRSAAAKLHERFSPGGATLEDAVKALAANEGHTGRAAKSLRKRYPQKVSASAAEMNPLHGGAPRPEPEPEPEPVMGRQRSAAEGAEERSPLVPVRQLSDAPLSPEDRMSDADLYDLEAGLPSSAEPAGRCARSYRALRRCCGRWHEPVPLRLALYLAGFALVQSGLWSGLWAESAEPVWTFGLPGWLTFCAATTKGHATST
eukprot:COSAG04_NODE_2749_length_3644_cov_4.300705_3_plen_213_part_00